MAALIEILAVANKELRELLHRPALVLTLLVGPLLILIIFGLGSGGPTPPPRVIVVLPSGQEEPRLFEQYWGKFEQSLTITDYTDDEEYARNQLRRSVVDAVLILPPSPFETIAGGQRATITVLYDELDPLWRGLVPNYVRALAGEINRAIFLQTATEQRDALAGATSGLDSVVGVLDGAIVAMEREDWGAARGDVRVALDAIERLMPLLDRLGPQGVPLGAVVERAQARLAQIDALLRVLTEGGSAPSAVDGEADLGLTQTRRSLVGLREAIDAYTTVSPEVLLAPLAVEAKYVARLRPDFLTYFAPAIMALLIQHVAISLGALAFVRERLRGTFGLFTVAPISNARLLLGKYIAYLCFTYGVAAVILGVLLGGLGIPLFGAPARLLVAMLLLSLASIGLGFAFSLLASSERQAVQFSMFALLGIVFFSGFALPLTALRQPALTVSYALPATYGVILFQDVMLRGLPGSDIFYGVLAAMSIGAFCLCLGLLYWRTRPL